MDPIWGCEELPDESGCLCKRIKKKNLTFLDVCYSSQIYILMDINPKYLVTTP